MYEFMMTFNKSYLVRHITVTDGAEDPVLRKQIFVKAIGVPVHLAFALERVRAERARVLRLQAAVLAPQHVEG